MRYVKLGENSDKIIQPLGLGIELNEHQKTAICAMKRLEIDGYIEVDNILNNKDMKIESTMGILGDKVGSGKSLMIVGLMLDAEYSIIRDKYYTGSEYISTKTRNVNNGTWGNNLLVIPHQLIIQWEEFYKFAPSLRIYKCTTQEEIVNLEDIKEGEKGRLYSTQKTKRI